MFNSKIFSMYHFKTFERFAFTDILNARDDFSSRWELARQEAASCVSHPMRPPPPVNGSRRGGA